MEDQSDLLGGTAQSKRGALKLIQTGFASRDAPRSVFLSVFDRSMLPGIMDGMTRKTLI